MSYAIETFDPEIFAAIENERERQTDHLEMIASENFTLPAVMEAMGSVFTNKYAEGYPYKRYYGGCEFADTVEQLAIDRACELSTVLMPMSNHTQEAKPMEQSMLHSSKQERRYLVWT